MTRTLPRNAPAIGQLFTMVAETVLVAVAMVLVYWLLPIQDHITVGFVFRLVGGLIVTAVVLAWQVRAITRSTHPIARAVRGLVVSLLLFILAFAITYLTLSKQDPQSFSTPLAKMNGLYFTVTVLTTVGFGDITPRTSVAQAITTIQMLLDLVFLAVGVRLLVKTALHARSGLEPDSDKL